MKGLLGFNFFKLGPDPYPYSDLDQDLRSLQWARDPGSVLHSWYQDPDHEKFGFKSRQCVLDFFLMTS